MLDPETLDLVPRFEELRDAAAEEPGLNEAITGELISSEIEIVSGRGEDIHDALANQRERRRLLFALAAARGVAFGSTGTHPWADYREQPNIDTEHYRRVVDGLGYVARRNNTFSLHVHVGVRDADRAVLACDRLRPILPLLLAASASSPFLEGHDTRLHSVRTQTFTKSFPRCGVPDAYGSWQAFRDYLAAADRHGLDRRVHAGLVVRAPARDLRHDRGSDRRRADHGCGVRRARVADRRLRGADAARHRRRRAVRRPSAAACRGEHVARDPLRDGRPDDRPAPRRRGADARRRRRPLGVDRAGARRVAASTPRYRAPTAPSASGRHWTAERACARFTLTRCVRQRPPTPRRFPHEHGSQRNRPIPTTPTPSATRSCARPTRPSLRGSASTTSSSRPSSRC